MSSILRVSGIRPRHIFRISTTTAHSTCTSTTRTLTTLANEDIYDITIVGGGPAGLALTTALRSSRITRPLRIALIEAQPTLTNTLSWAGAAKPPSSSSSSSSSSETPYSNRVVSLTPRVVQFLTDIGAWKWVRRERVCGYSGMKVWDGGSEGVVEFDGLEGGAGLLGGLGGGIGYMTENVNLMYGLVKRLEEVAGEEGEGEGEGGCLSVFERTKVVGISLDSQVGGEGKRVLEEAADSEKRVGGGVEVADVDHWPRLRLELPQDAAAGGGAQKEIKTRLLVGADGANSPVRRFAEIGARGWEYGRVGIVATLEIDPLTETENGGQKVAYQRFLPTGPIALLPLPGKSASLVWSTTPAHANSLKSLPLETFTMLVNAALVLPQLDIEYYLSNYIPTLLATHPTSPTHIHDSLQEDIQWRLSTLPPPHSHPSSSSLPIHLPLLSPTPPPSPPKITKTITPPQSFPLKLTHVHTYLSPPHRSLLLGDAAHTIHPLAGLGLNLGLLDAQSLAGVLEHAVINGMDLGGQLALERYPSERYVENERVLTVVDGLHKVFQVGGLGGWVRGVGMGVVQSLGPLKGWLMGRVGQ